MSAQITSNEPDFASPECAIYWRYISSSLDRIMAVLEGRCVPELNWRPPAPETNSIYALAVHTLANARENILGTLCGGTISRDHATEFGSVADTTDASVPGWPEARHKLRDALAHLTPDELDSVRTHPRRGNITGREVLVIVARHTAEHLGQAELTRDLAVATLSQQG